MSIHYEKISTFGQLKASGYQTKTIKDELRCNLIRLLQQKQDSFEGIIGYNETVIPDLQRALLSRHNIVFLGLRGQAKTRMARLMHNLLDEYIPIVADSELNDDPFHPISKYAKDLIDDKGEDTPIEWVHRDHRYTEKLATPDVTVADLIGDVDPIKAASMKLHYNDERVIHFGLIPRSNRSIFVINELPDLQARIQVALFNILQEEDIQIRGFKLRLPLDIQFVFTANPEDYTNRGSIVTPLKDRIDSQILTHYPKSIDVARKITEQEAHISETQKESIVIPDLIKDLIEEIAFQARESEYVDIKSGVSARLTISAYENLYSAAERRMLINKEQNTVARISDLYGIIPSITGKVELVYEGEQEGPLKIAHILINKAIRTFFKKYFPDPEKVKKVEAFNPFQKIVDWFSAGNELELLLNASNKQYKQVLEKIDGLAEMIDKQTKLKKESDKLLLMEFALFGLSEYSFLSKTPLDARLFFRDMLSSMLDEEDDDYKFGDQESY